MCPQSLSRAVVVVFLSCLLLAWLLPSNQGAIVEPTKQRLTDNEPSPVVLIPGFGGAQSYTIKNHKTHATRKWINLNTFVKPENFANNFKLFYNITSHTTYDPKNRKIIFPGFGKTWVSNILGSVVGYTVKYFNDLVQRLLMHPFYSDGTTLSTVSYDFRRAPNENRLLLVQMKHLIENMYVRSGNRRVVIVTHSMGGLYGLLFLNNMTAQWKQKYVRAFVPASAPWSGAAKALRSIVYGEDFGLFFVPANKMRILTSSLPSTYFLLPQYPTWSKDEVLLTVGNKYAFTLNNISTLFMKTKNIPGYHMYFDTRDLLNARAGPTDVDEVYCIYSLGKPTYSQLVYPDVGDDLSKILDIAPKDIFEDGDGTVAWRSLRICENWRGNRRNVRYLNTEHLSIISDERYINEIEEIVLAGDKHRQSKTDNA